MNVISHNESLFQVFLSIQIVSSRKSTIVAKFRQISLLSRSQFKRINELQFSLKSSENLWSSDNCGGNWKLINSLKLANLFCIL